MFVVILKRGPLATKKYEEYSALNAARRARALAELHRCDVVREGDVWTVDAAEYYANAREPQ